MIAYFPCWHFRFHDTAMKLVTELGMIRVVKGLLSIAL